MTEFQYDLLDRYFQKELSPEEINAFRAGLEANAELREAFNLRRLSAAAVQRSAVTAFKEKALTAKQPAVEKQLPTARRRMLLWTVAASVTLLLAALGWWLWRQPDAARSQLLFAQYDVPDLYPKTDFALVNEGSTHKGIIGSQDWHDLKIRGLQAYESKDWDNAISLLGEYLAKAKSDNEETADEINLMNLYLGRAWLEKGDASKAIAALKRGAENVKDKVNHGYLQELMWWHLTLAHLKNNDTASAKKIAQLLTGAQHPVVKEQAQKLLMELK